MLAKVPPKRKDGKSDFHDLIEYATNREEDEERLSDDIDLSDRRRHRQMLAQVHRHLQTAENYLRAIGPRIAIDPSAIRALREQAICTVARYNRNSHQESIERSKYYLRTAADHLQQTQFAEKHFQTQARRRHTMLANGPASIWRNSTTFTANHKLDKDILTDERDPSQRGRHLEILERAGGHLRAAGHHLQTVGRIAALDAVAIRVRLESIGRIAHSHRPIHGRSRHRVKDADNGDGELDGHSYQRSIIRARYYLATAAKYLDQAEFADRDFQAGARARRANLTFHVAAAQRTDGRNEADLIAEFGNIGGQVQSTVTASGVSCQHNCLTLQTAAAEMTGVAAMNARVKDPVYHVILTWPAPESPTDAQAFDCGAYALKAVGMADHQYVFAVHRDTGNVHLHVTVNRVHPESFRAVYPDRDFFKLDRAMRELELRYGWQHVNGPYAVFNREGTTVVDWASKNRNSKEKAPTAVKDMERFSGQESFFSYLRGDPRKAVVALLNQEDLTWQALHQALAHFGLEICPKGQGMAIYDVNDKALTPIKASDMHEGLSKSRLVKRLGAYESPAALQLEKALHRYDKHREIKRDPHMREERRHQRATARRDLKARYDAYKKTFIFKRLDSQDVKARYAELQMAARRRREDVRHSIADAATRKAFYSVIAFETLRSRDRLRRQIAKERDTLNTDPCNHRMSYREWVEREAASGDQAAISQLRGWAHAETRKVKEFARIEQDPLMDAIRHDEPVDALATKLGNGVDYQVTRRGEVAYQINGQRVFVDHGRIIAFEKGASVDEKAVRAALQLAKKKFDTAIDLSGTDEFQHRAIAVMIKHKIDVRLKNDRLEAMRRQLVAQVAAREALGKARPHKFK